MSKEIRLPNYETVEPIQLYYRNTEDCVQSLFGNPLFADHMTYTPYRQFDTDGVRIFSEWMTGDNAWKVQVSSFFSLYRQILKAYRRVACRRVRRLSASSRRQIKQR